MLTSAYLVLQDFFVDKGFAQNMISGLLVFILDVALVAVYLPRLLSRRQEASFQVTRKFALTYIRRDFDVKCIELKNLTESQRRAKTDATYTRDQLVADTKLVVRQIENEFKAFSSVLPVVAPALSTQLAQEVAVYTMSASLVHSLLHNGSNYGTIPEPVWNAVIGYMESCEQAISELERLTGWKTRGLTSTNS